MSTNLPQPSTYQGLINEGSTCYLNSLIQTLFMTPEFRKNVYAYVHNSKKLENKNSIPFQLQKLFVVLQTTKQKPLSTKGLLKSFQWTEADAFEQHDVQEFCRKLFQAIEISNKKAHWITDLFEGSMISFVDCGKHSSEKQQTFMDISLSIHNPYTKVQYQSLEECIKEYLKTEKLDDKFLCEDCGEKVDVQKGLKICKLPPLLTLQLNRFELNYETWQREKLNTFLYFPQVLYMGKFLKKYQEITISELPADLKSKIKVTEKQKSARTANIYGDFGSQPPKVPGQVPKVKPKRKNSDEIETTKAKVFMYDDPKMRQREEKPLTKEEEKQKNREILQGLKNSFTDVKKKVEKIPVQKPVPVCQSLQDDMLFGSGMGLLSDCGPAQWTSGTTDPNASIGSKPNFSKTQTTFQHQQQVFTPSKEYPDHTYALYAVLVHSGGAYGGHYFAFISNGKDWYRFDDSTVRKVSRYEMRKYGNFDKVVSGANAYLLFYRDVRTFKESDPDEIEIPEELMEKVKQDQEEILKSGPQQPSRAQKRLQQIIHGVMIKIVNLHGINPTQHQSISPLQPHSLFIQNRHQQTIFLLKQRIHSIYPQLSLLGPSNWRLRRYNKLDESLHEVYTQAFDGETLDGLGFRETVWVAVETKKSQDSFEEYDAKQIIVKVNVWRPDITIVSEKALKPIKIQLSQQSPFTSLVQKISQKFSIPTPVILKRTFSTSNPILIFPNSQSKKLIQLKFFNGINLYIQQPFPNQKSRWVEQFQSQKYRCCIKYNNPQESQSRDHQVYFDTRKTLKQLKQHLAQKINLPLDEFRIKKSRQAVGELIAYNKKLYDLKFIANQFIFLEKGKSSCGVVILKQAKVQVVDGSIEFTLLQQTIINLDENMTTVEHILSKLSQHLNTPPHMLRIREYKAYQFGEIYRLTQPIQRIKQKSLIWQRIKSQEISQLKGLQIYIRQWDVVNMELGELKQVYVDAGASGEEMALVLEQQLGIKPSRLLVWKALSNFVDKGLLLDCDWVQVGFIKRKIKEQPLFIMTDGDIFIVKEAEKDYHARLSPIVLGTASSNWERGKQAQLKITVMAENSDEEEQMMKKALEESMKQEEEEEKVKEKKEQGTKEEGKNIVKGQEHV